MYLKELSGLIVYSFYASSSFDYSSYEESLNQKDGRVHVKWRLEPCSGPMYVYHSDVQKQRF